MWRQPARKGEREGGAKKQWKEDPQNLTDDCSRRERREGKKETNVFSRFYSKSPEE